MKYLLDPMEDARLTRSMDYPIWHYCFCLEMATQPLAKGFVYEDPLPSYQAGRTPRAAMVEVVSRAHMGAIDALPDFFRWVNNNALNPAEFNALYKAAGPVRPHLQIGQDKGEYVLQFWAAGACYAAMRFDRKAPPPPGWEKKS